MEKLESEVAAQRRRKHEKREEIVAEAALEETQVCSASDKIMAPLINCFPYLTEKITQKIR